MALAISTDVPHHTATWNSDRSARACEVASWRKQSGTRALVSQKAGRRKLSSFSLFPPELGHHFGGDIARRFGPSLGFRHWLKGSSQNAASDQSPLLRGIFVFGFQGDYPRQGSVGIANDNLRAVLDGMKMGA